MLTDRAIAPATLQRMRIVSLLPSATEIVCALGLRDQLVGRSHECDFPLDVASLPPVSLARIAGDELSSSEIDAAVSQAIERGEELYGFDEGVLAELAPDVIVTQSLCTVCAVSGDGVRRVARARGIAPSVVELAPDGLEGIAESVLELGRALGVEARARELADDLRVRLAAAGVANRTANPRRTVVLEWLDPPFAAGHWVPEQVELAGGIELLGSARAPSFRTDWTAVRAAAPELVVLAPCGFDEHGTRTRMLADGVERELAGLRATIACVDATSHFSRPGPRVVEGVELLARLYRDL